MGVQITPLGAAWTTTASWQTEAGAHNQAARRALSDLVYRFARCFISARLDGPVRNPSGFSTDLRRPGQTDPESYKMVQRRCCSVR
jgi:hypothetical protein